MICRQLPPYFDLTDKRRPGSADFLFMLISYSCPFIITLLSLAARYSWTCTNITSSIQTFVYLSVPDQLDTFKSSWLRAAYWYEGLVLTVSQMDQFCCLFASSTYICIFFSARRLDREQHTDMTALSQVDQFFFLFVCSCPLNKGAFKIWVRRRFLLEPRVKLIWHTFGKMYVERRPLGLFHHFV